MKKLLVLIFIFSSGINHQSQRTIVGKDTERREILIKKQIICDDLERQAKEIPFSAIRVFARYKIASWLWKDGKDDIGRAEHIAVVAIDDLYENKNEIPPVYFNALVPDLFALLDRNAKETATKLREKYKHISDNESGLFDSLLNQKDGDKLAVDFAIRSLSNKNENNSELGFLLYRLKERGSPELYRILPAIVGSEERGRTRFTAETLLFMSVYFVEQRVPFSLQKRFLKVIVDKSRYAAQMPDGDAEGYFHLLGRVMADIANRHQELFSEATIVHTILRTKVSNESRETQERNERIENSPDKLIAIVSEAERAEHKTIKYTLYIGAAQLALQLKKFVYSVDLLQKSAEIDMSANSISDAFRKQWRDQFLGDVSEKALQSDDPESASYAVKQMTDVLNIAESLGKAAKYYADRADFISARNSLDESVKFATKSDASPRSISILIKMLSTAQKIDPSRVFELNQIIAKSIRAIPSLNVEDKPETENYKNYVTKIMIVNWNLLPALTRLAKTNQNAATDLVNRIEKKEIKIIGNYVLLTESIPNGTDEKKGQGSATLLK